MDKGAADVRGTIEIMLNDLPAATLALTPDNNDLFHQFVLKNVRSGGHNRIGVHFEGKGRPCLPGGGTLFRAVERSPG
jgi:hypothetical protein